MQFKINCSFIKSTQLGEIHK